MTSEPAALLRLIGDIEDKRMRELRMLRDQLRLLVSIEQRAPLARPQLVRRRPLGTA